MKGIYTLLLAAAATVCASLTLPAPRPADAGWQPAHAGPRPKHPATGPLYKDPAAPVSARVADLLKRMTPEEKIMQLNQATLGLNDNENNINDPSGGIDPHVGSLIYFGNDPVLRNKVQKKAMEGTRLGIPILFGFDIIHGCKTLFPIPLATGCSWNTGLAGQACAVAAKETYLSGINWTFSPMIDVARDPRWGRVAEGYGEDPYTTAMFGAAAVRGYQGTRPSDSFHIAACLKHFVAYGLSEGGRDYTYTDVSPQALWETYLVPYKAGVQAGALTLMSAFNDISGVPATANQYLLTDVLKRQWGFKGLVVSDWEAVGQLMNQGVAKDPEEAGKKAMNAGLDMDMLSGIYVKYAKDLLAKGAITQGRVDDAVTRVLTVKFELGLFDHPYTPELPENQRYLQPESKAIAAQLAAESMVLLKNNHETLPIPYTANSIAVIGPMVKDSADLMGSWRGRADSKDVTSIYTALQTAFAGKATLHYAKGCDFDGTDQQGFDEAVQAAQNADEVILFLGEKNGWSGENTSRSTIALPAIQEQLAAAIKKTGKPVIIVLTNGRPLALANLEPSADAILEAWQPGTVGASAIAGILSGVINPSGKLDITFPLTTGQIPTYYDMRQSSRPHLGQYQDIPTDPLYWFGHGLSYTTYTYGRVQLSSATVTRTGHLKAEVLVTNGGHMEGKETVLWFISHPAASISRPMKELKHFEKKLIRPDQTVVYTFDIDPARDLSFPGPDGTSRLEAGDYYLSVGDQKIRFTLTDGPVKTK